MALIWSKKSTGVPIRVKTSHVTGGVLNEDGERKIGDKISECVLDIGALVLLLLLQLFVSERLQLTHCLYSMLYTTTIRHLQKLPQNHITYTIHQQLIFHWYRDPSPHQWQLDHLQITRGSIPTATSHHHTLCQTRNELQQPQ